MDLDPAIKFLEKSDDFREWKKKNKLAYFSYALKITEEKGADDWQLGFYDSKSDRITTFVINGEDIKMRPEEEIFKREDMKVNGIELDKVRLSFEDAIEKAIDLQKKEYPKDSSVKTIAILQNIGKFGNVWNITFVTAAFNVLNIKLNATNGKIIEHKITSVFSFKQA